MRKGTLSNQTHSLKIVSGSQEAIDDSAAHYPYQTNTGAALIEEDARHAKTTFLLLIGISIACTTAALATGSYAAWLARHQAARKALTDVNEILRSCQSRMSQLESDVQRLPNRHA